MKNKLFFCLMLLVSMQIKAITGLELATGAIVYKALKTQTAKTMGAVILGYFLNTAMGRQLSVNIKDLMLKKMLSNQAENNFRISSGPDKISNFSEVRDIVGFSKASSYVALIKEKFSAMNPFGYVNSKLNLFYDSEKVLGAQGFNGINGCFHSQSTLGKIVPHLANDAKVTNIMTAQQARGFCPKIENNFYTGGYWKGFAHGSFGAWLSAYFLTSDKSQEKKEEVAVG